MKRMRFKRVVPTVLLVSALAFPILAPANACEAAVNDKSNKCFVDEVNNMGYYIDTSTIKFDSYCTFIAEVSIARPYDKLLFVYEARFNLEQHAYRYLTSKIYHYEGKKLISENNNSTIAQDYNRVSAVKEVVEFALDYAKKHPKEIVIPDPPPPPPPPEPVEDNTAVLGDVQ